MEFLIWLKKCLLALSISILNTLNILDTMALTSPQGNSVSNMRKSASSRSLKTLNTPNPGK